MKRVNLWAIALCCVFGMLLAAIYVCGPLLGEPASMMLFGFKRCEMPCAMGVTLGRTTYTEALAALAGRPVPSGYTSQIQVEQSSYGEHQIRLNWSDAAGDNHHAWFYFDNRDVVNLMRVGRVPTSQNSGLMPT